MELATALEDSIEQPDASTSEWSDEQPSAAPEAEAGTRPRKEKRKMSADHSSLITIAEYFDNKNKATKHQL